VQILHLRPQLGQKQSNFGSLGPEEQLDLLKFFFSVRDPSGHVIPLNSQADGVTGYRSDSMNLEWLYGDLTIQLPFRTVSEVVRVAST